MDPHSTYDSLYPLNYYPKRDDISIETAVFPQYTLVTNGETDGRAERITKQAKLLLHYCCNLSKGSISEAYQDLTGRGC